MEFLRNLLPKSSAGNKRKAKAVNGDFQQELLSPENDYRVDNQEILNYNLQDSFFCEIEKETYYLKPDKHPFVLAARFDQYLTEIEKEDYNKNYTLLQRKLHVFPDDQKQIPLSEILQTDEYIKLQKYFLINNYREKEQELAATQDSISINFFRLATFHENTYLAGNITNNSLSKQSVEKIQKTINQLGFNQAIGYVHTGNHWKSLIIEGNEVQKVDPFNPTYKAPDDSLVMGAKQSDGVSCSLFSLVNNVLFLNRVNATDVGVTTRDVQAIKSAISYKGNLCYNSRAKVLLQHFADRILVQGLIKKVEKSSLSDKDNILEKLNQQYSSLLRGCNFNSSIKSVVHCFNPNIVNTKLLNETELLYLFDVSKKLQQLQVVKKEEDVQPRLVMPQNDTDAERSRIQNTDQISLQSKQKTDNLTIVKEALINLESKLQTNSGISADKTAAEFITALKNNLNSQKNDQESKTPEAIILDSLSKTDYGNLLSQSNSRFNNKSTFTKDDLIVFTGSDDDFDKFIKDVMPVYEEIERNAKMIKSSLNQMTL